MTRRKAKQRIRPRLLVLLWAWAACMFLVVDLFLNVAEFDTIRPEGTLYRSTRYAAHRMVGEPWRDGALVEFEPLTSSFGRAGRTLGERLREVSQARDPALVREIARSDPDPRVRASALRRCVRLEGERARSLLGDVVADADERDKVRTEAARLLGVTGPDAYPELEALLADEQPLCVRLGAVAGLAHNERSEAIERVITFARADPALRAAATSAVRDSRSPFHRWALARVASDPGAGEALRLAACTALERGERGDAPGELLALVANESAPDTVRQAAARALGRIGDPAAMPALMKAGQGNGSPAWAREVRRARARLTKRE